MIITLSVEAATWTYRCTLVCLITATALSACRDDDPVSSGAPGPLPHNAAESQIDRAAASGDAGSDAAAATAPSCPFPAPFNTPMGASCPSDCTAVIGSEFDPALNCVRNVHVGCISCWGRRCGGAPEGYCYKNVHDGRLVEVGSYVMEGQTGWLPCTQSDSQKMSSPLCNSPDGG
jgi:hypothetical protein